VALSRVYYREFAYSSSLFGDRTRRNSWSETPRDEILLYQAEVVVVKSKTIPEALQFVADHPQPSSDNALLMPAWEHVSRSLFEIANSPNPKVKGSMARATKAQKIILDRLVGRRRPGTHPAQSKSDEIEFVDLTQAVIQLPEPKEETEDDRSD